MITTLAVVTLQLLLVFLAVAVVLTATTPAGLLLGLTLGLVPALLAVAYHWRGPDA